MLPYPDFWVGVGDPNSGSHVYTASFSVLSHLPSPYDQSLLSTYCVPATTLDLGDITDQGLAGALERVYQGR